MKEPSLEEVQSLSDEEARETEARLIVQTDNGPKPGDGEPDIERDVNPEFKEDATDA